MAAGYPIGVNDINSKAGALATGLWDALDDCHRFYLWLNDATHADATLVALGMLQPDVTLIKNSFNDIGNLLYNVSHGVSSTGANNFFVNAKQLTGTNYAG